MSKIYCIENKRGVDSFYVEHEGIRYYLFSQDFHTGVDKYFRDGVRLDDALRNRKGDHCVRKTKEKFRAYIKYIEKEYGIKILDTTIKKSAINKAIYNRASETRGLHHAYYI